MTVSHMKPQFLSLEKRDDAGSLSNILQPLSEMKLIDHYLLCTEGSRGDGYWKTYALALKRLCVALSNPVFCSPTYLHLK